MSSARSDYCVFLLLTKKLQFHGPWCLKITEKVSFSIASEASYVYILSGQKFVKNAKNGQFLRVFESLKLARQTVLPDMSILTGKKIKIQMRHFE